MKKVRILHKQLITKKYLWCNHLEYRTIKILNINNQKAKKIFLNYFMK